MRLFLVIIGALAVFLFFLFPVTDFDIWFHLADGKFIIENLKAPTGDIYSYSAQGNSAPSNSWGFAALSYLIYKAGGLDGLNFVKALVSLLIFLAIIFYLRKEKSLNPISLSFVVLALYSIREQFSLRPHTFSYLIFVVFLILLFKYRREKNYKWISFIALTQFVWVNFHGSFIWGIAFGAILFLSDTILNRKIDKKDAVLAGSVFLVSFLNVFYGYNYILRILRGYFASFNAPIREHMPPTLETFMSLMGLVLLSLLLVLYFSWREKRYDILLALPLLAAVSLTNQRFLRELILFTCLTAPPCFQKIKIPRINFKIPSGVLTAACLIILFFVFLGTKNSSLGIGLGLQKFTYPSKAAEFIKSEKLLEKSGGQLYNTYNFGGYLLWTMYPQKIFIDGRMEPYEKEIFPVYWQNFEGGAVWKESVEKYNITVALMTLPHGGESKVYNDSSKMFPKAEWALVYYDDASMMYVKRIPAFGDLIKKYEYKILNPQTVDFSYLQETIKSQGDFDAAFLEIKRGLEINPESYRLRFTLSYLYNLIGAEKEMIKEIDETLKINPYFGPAQEIKNQYLLGKI